MAMTRNYSVINYVKYSKTYWQWTTKYTGLWFRFIVIVQGTEQLKSIIKIKCQTKSLCNDMFIAMYLFRLSNNGFAWKTDFFLVMVSVFKWEQWSYIYKQKKYFYYG